MTNKEIAAVLDIEEAYLTRLDADEQLSGYLGAALVDYARLVRMGLSPQAIHTISLFHFARVFSATSFIGDNG